jgi:acyl-CoA hydrolase
VLRGHRDIGVHSRLVGDEIVELRESGVRTNARKALDRFVAVNSAIEVDLTRAVVAEVASGHCVRGAATFLRSAHA